MAVAVALSTERGEPRLAGKPEPCRPVSVSATGAAAAITFNDIGPQVREGFAIAARNDNVTGTERSDEVRHRLRTADLKMPCPSLPFHTLPAQTQPVWVYDVPLNRHGNQAVSRGDSKVGRFQGQAQR